MLKLFFQILVFIQLTACVTSQRFEEKRRSSIGKVSVEVQALPEFSYFGPAYAFKKGLANAVGGAFGGAVEASNTATNQSAEFIAALDDQKYDLKSEIKDNIAKSFETKLGIKVEDSNVDARVTINVLHFGLAKGWGLRDQTAPFFDLLVEMKDNAGIVVWREHDGISPLDYECNFRSAEEWLKQPDFLQSEIDKSLKILLDKIVDSARPSASEKPTSKKR